MFSLFFRQYFARRSVIAGLVSFGVLMVLAFFMADTPFVVSVVCVAVLYLALEAILTWKDLQKNGTTASGPALSGMAVGFVGAFSRPAAMVNETGEIIWYNKAFSGFCEPGAMMYGKKPADVFSPSLNVARLFSNKTEPVDVSYHGRTYAVECYPLASSGQKHCMMLWEDVTENSELKEEMDKRSLMVAFIVIDNFSEAIQSVQDKQRTALALIGGALDAWAASVGGILKEYDKDKFIMLFEKRWFDTLDESRFDILDKVREIEVENLSMPFTVSVGVSKIDGTFAEKESAARYALDLALQRGGDQAVVKSENTVDYYGGRSKSVQKKTKVRSRVIAKELSALIEQSGNVIVMGHKYADHDAIASCVAVARLAKYLGKPVNVVVNIHDFNLKKIFESMRGQNGEYDELFIDRDMAHERIRSDTLLVVCDVNNPAFFELPELYEAACHFVVIDHHRKTGEYLNQPKISYIEPASSSASELMSEILELSLPSGTLLKAEANLLFAGILLDTKQFSKNTGVKTFSAAVYLRGEGADPAEANRLFSTSIEDFLRESLFENNVHIYKNCVAISVYEKEIEQKDKIAASKAADRLLSVEGIRASFVLCLLDGAVHISSRSDGSVNVQLVLEKLGGGGHYDAAGTQMDGVTLEEALKSLKGAIDEYWEQNQP